MVTFNLIATFTVKVYQCASNKGSGSKSNQTTTSQSQIGEGGLAQAKSASVGSLRNLAGPAVGKNPKLPQSSAMVKTVGGLKGMFGENRKYFLNANSEYLLILYPAVKLNVEDSKTNASSVGYSWNAAHANVFEVLIKSPTEFKIKIDAESYHVTFEDEGVATVWNTYFQVIIRVTPIYM